jgi:hypothetical protein
MSAWHGTLLGGVGLAFLLSASIRLASASSTEDERRKEIDAFNNNNVELHLKMDTQAIFVLWAADGVDLMPGEAPIVGKKAIVAWAEDILAKMPGHKVLKQEMEFHDIHLSGDWASEWATEHQVVQPPDGKPLIEGLRKNGVDSPSRSERPMVERRPQALIRWADSSKGVIRSAAKGLNGKLRQAPQVAAQVLYLAK